MMVMCRGQCKNFDTSKLNVFDFPENIKEFAKANYCGDNAAIQGYGIFEYTRERTHNSLFPHPNFVDEDTAFDESGIYYGYVLSCDVSKNRKWYKVKVLLSFDTVRIIFVSTNIQDPKALEIHEKFGCSVSNCVRKIVKLTVKNIDYGDDVKSFVNKFEPVSNQEKQMLYFAGPKLLEGSID